MTDKERIAHLEAEVADLKAELRAKLDTDHELVAELEQTIKDTAEAHHLARLREIGFISDQFFGAKLVYDCDDVRRWEARSRHVSRVLHRDRVCYVVRPEGSPPSVEETEGETDSSRFPFS